MVGRSGEQPGRLVVVVVVGGMIDPQVEGNFLTLVIGFESNFPSLDSAFSKVRTLKCLGAWTIGRRRILTAL